MRYSLRSVCRRTAVLALTCFVAAIQPASPVTAADETPLQTVLADIAKRWPNVPRLSPDELSGMMASQDVVLFDVRSQAEYQVSRLKGAIRVDPDMDDGAFAAKFGSTVNGKPVVFYCSVGVRSSRLADRLRNLTALGVSRAHNLTGGIFAWHNEARPLVDANGATQYVHPYDRKWGRLVDRKALTRSGPAR